MSQRIYPILVAFFCLLLLPGSEAAANEPQLFSVQQLREDLAELLSFIERTHPDVEHSVRKTELARALAGVKSR